MLNCTVILKYYDTMVLVKVLSCLYIVSMHEMLAVFRSNTAKKVVTDFAV